MLWWSVLRGSIKLPSSTATAQQNKKSEVRVCRGSQVGGVHSSSAVKEASWILLLRGFLLLNSAATSVCCWWGQEEISHRILNIQAEGCEAAHADGGCLSSPKSPRKSAEVKKISLSHSGLSCISCPLRPISVYYEGTNGETNNKTSNKQEALSYLASWEYSCSLALCF